MTTETNTSTATVEEAITALANLGVTGAIDIGTAHDPDLILGWCRWAEERRQGGQQVGTGLIVRNIRTGQQAPRAGRSASASAPDRKRAELRSRFRERALPFPPGSVCETHAAAEMRRRRSHGQVADELFPEDRDDEPTPVDDSPVCGGDLIVIDRGGLVLTARCDTCREEMGYPLRALAGLPRAPLAKGRPLPPAAGLARRPPEGGWWRGEGDFKKLDPAATLAVSVDREPCDAAA